MSPLLRPPQLRGTFVAGDPWSGYYNDLRVETAAYSTPRAGQERLAGLTRERARANPVTIAQLGLAAWQRLDEDGAWAGVVDGAARWLVDAAGIDGLILYRFPLTHTYALSPPWASAMAQGEAASLLVRAARLVGRPHLLEEARRVARPLIDERSSLVVRTPEGPVLQEYPTSPPSHVLNGWISALWGLYDVGVATGDEPARAAFEDGLAALTARLHLYSAGWRWSRYDLYPHPLVHAASPFYHRLHVEQLRALNDLAPDPRLAATAERWSAGSANPVAIALGTAHKIAFRLVRPRRQHALARRSPRT